MKIIRYALQVPISSRSPHWIGVHLDLLTDLGKGNGFLDCGIIIWEMVSGWEMHELFREIAPAVERGDRGRIGSAVVARLLGWIRVKGRAEDGERNKRGSSRAPDGRLRLVCLCELHGITVACPISRADTRQSSCPSSLSTHAWCMSLLFPDTSWLPMRLHSLFAVVAHCFKQLQSLCFWVSLVRSQSLTRTSRRCYFYIIDCIAGVVACVYAVVYDRSLPLSERQRPEFAMLWAGALALLLLDGSSSSSITSFLCSLALPLPLSDSDGRPGSSSSSTGRCCRFTLYSSSSSCTERGGRSSSPARDRDLHRVAVTQTERWGKRQAVLTGTA